jgi:hypothetical protein
MIYQCHDGLGALGCGWIGTWDSYIMNFLHDGSFKNLCGITPSSFQKLVDLLQEDLQVKVK